MRRSESANGRDVGSWFPTHFTKNVKWMGHGALTAGQVSATCLLSAKRAWVRGLPGAQKRGTWGTHLQWSYSLLPAPGATIFSSCTHFSRHLGHLPNPRSPKARDRGHPLCGVEKSSRPGPAGLMTGPPAGALFTILAALRMNRAKTVAQLSAQV